MKMLELTDYYMKILKSTRNSTDPIIKEVTSRIGKGSVPEVLILLPLTSDSFTRQEKTSQTGKGTTIPNALRINSLKCMP